jgi:hypothetical protein
MKEGAGMSKLPATIQTQIDDMLSAARRGDYSSLYRATTVGRVLGGDGRDALFRDVQKLLAEHKARDA